MRKLLLVTAACALAVPAFAQNAPSDLTPSKDPDPRVQTDINRDAQQSGGGAARSGPGGPATTGSGAGTQGQGGMQQGQGGMQSGTPRGAPDLPPRTTPEGSSGMPGDKRGQ